MEHDDVAALHLDHLVAAGRNFCGAGDDVTGHFIQDPASKLVERTGVAVEDFCPFGFGERRLERKPRIIKVPMRIIRRKRSKCWSIRHIVDEIQPKPPSMNTIFRRGKRSSTPSMTRLVSVAAIECAFDWCSSA